MQSLFKIETTMGDIVVELYQDKAPLTVANFCRYANNNHYVSTIFHRVIPGFMIQGGGYKVDMVKNKRYEPIRNEAGKVRPRHIGYTLAQPHRLHFVI